MGLTVIGLVLDWFLAPEPGAFPVRLMVIGLGVLLAGGVARALRQVTSRRALLVGGTLLSAGYWFTSIAVLRGSYDLYAAYLYLLFHATEGAAAAHFYRRVVHAFQQRSLPGGGQVRTRVLHLAALFSVVLSGVGLFAYRSGVRSVTGQAVSIGLTYTIIAVGVTSLGVWWRVRPLRNDYRIPTLLGFAACVTGAELYGYATPSLDIIVALAGAAVHVSGFWIAVGVWVLRGHLLP
ncbi:hypothetical protein E4P24_16115 [Haloferax sp. AS1]|uniref:hypothetical protein n=1 Tax=Haloferax TaxID=2251 RepID=UPI00165FD9DC|nr:hypothetical protein [Haloferax sp. AS1]MBC9987881.1 hypothetical protein [Haloferax sp. AS1]